MASNALYTFGYEGLDISAFIARLTQSGVRNIVDVRELPLSRKKGFSKNSFRDNLAAAGIGYFHAPPLGCPKQIRDRYRANGNWQEYTRDFMTHLAKQDATVRELAKLARATTTCLVCFEANYSECHRSYVARAAHRVGAPLVVHLTSKTAVPDQALRIAA